MEYTTLRIVWTANTEMTKLTPWSTVLLEKLTVTKLVKKFLPIYRIERFIAAFNRTYYWDPS
jgi:hypothetical protein